MKQACTRFCVVIAEEDPLIKHPVSCVVNIRYMYYLNRLISGHKFESLSLFVVEAYLWLL